jgi:hypothetical protein
MATASLGLGQHEIPRCARIAEIPGYSGTKRTAYFVSGATRSTIVTTDFLPKLETGWVKRLMVENPVRVFGE